MRSAVLGYGGAERAVQLVANGAAEISRRMGYRPAVPVNSTTSNGNESYIDERQVS
jgi:hypothetical protein